MKKEGVCKIFLDFLGILLLVGIFGVIAIIPAGIGDIILTHTHVQENKNLDTTTTVENTTTTLECRTRIYNFQYCYDSLCDLENTNESIRCYCDKDTLGWDMREYQR